MQGYPARGRQQLHVMQCYLCKHTYGSGQTGLHSATMQGKEDMVDLLLATGAEIDPRSKDNTRPEPGSRLARSISAPVTKRRTTQS